MPVPVTAPVIATRDRARTAAASIGTSIGGSASFAALVHAHELGRDESSEIGGERVDDVSRGLVRFRKPPDVVRVEVHHDHPARRLRWEMYVRVYAHEVGRGRLDVTRQRRGKERDEDVAPTHRSKRLDERRRRRHEERPLSRTKEHATFGEHRARRARRVTLVERAKKRLENRVGTARRVPPDERRRESGTRESVGGGGWFQDGKEEWSAADGEEDRGRARGGKGESVDEGGDDVRDGRRVSSRAKKTRAMDGAEGRLENGDDRGAGREADALARAGGSEGGVGDARSLGDGLEEGEARDVDEGADAVGEDEGVRAGGERVWGGIRDVDVHAVGHAHECELRGPGGARVGRVAGGRDGGAGSGGVVVVSPRGVRRDATRRVGRQNLGTVRLPGADEPARVPRDRRRDGGEAAHHEAVDGARHVDRPRRGRRRSQCR